MVRWSQRIGALEPTLRTGYVAWLFLLVGVIMLLRAAGRGRTGWEPTAVVLVACLPPVWFCVEMYAHPQDVVAMAFAFAAMACALRNRGSQPVSLSCWPFSPSNMPCLSPSLSSSSLRLPANFLTARGSRDRSRHRRSRS